MNNTFLFVCITIGVLALGFFVLNSYIHNEKQADLDARDHELISALRDLAIEPTPDALANISFEDEVHLGLGENIETVVSADDLADPAAWEIDREEFRAYAGPFSALTLLANASETEVSVGPHPHCASPPKPSPTEMSDLRRVSVQPVLGENASCLEWWTVDLFVTDDHEVRAITLDLWEP